MYNAIVIKGRLVSATSVELEEPVSAVTAEVEVIVRPTHAGTGGPGETVTEFLRRLPPGHRTREDIDRQVREERDGWGEGR